MDDYANYPVSIDEAKANKADDAGLWSCRDALIACLRDIDSGIIKPNQLIICVAELQGDLTSFNYYRKQDSSLSGKGLLVQALKDS